MAAPNPGLDIATAPGLDPAHGQHVIEKYPSDGSSSDLPEHDAEKGAITEVEESPIAPDQFDERFETSRNEIWAYYACV